MFRHLFFLILLLTAAQSQAAQRLNNLVTLLEDRSEIASKAKLEFENPRAGWVYFEVDAAAPVTLQIPGVGEILRVEAAGHAETMRWLPQGTVKLRTKGAIAHLVIRTVPELQFARFPQEPRIAEQGKFSWEWLKANVLRNVNTIVFQPGPAADGPISQWVAGGGKCIAEGSVPQGADLTPESVFEQWGKHPGFHLPNFSGMICDEFNGRQWPNYPAWIGGAKLLMDATRDTDRRWYAYCGGPGLYSRPGGRALVQTVLDGGSYIVWERYLHEMPTQSEGTELMESMLGREMGRWRGVFPDIARSMVLDLGIFATGPDLNVEPGVDYKVWMDQQMQYVATRPEFDGLFGLQWWYSGYATEELLRWESALYRHYAIEGKTDLLSVQYGWNLLPGHVQNPDFLDGSAHWELAPTAPESLSTGYLERYARAENRYWNRGIEPDYPAGNAYLLMKRQAEKENRVSQTLQHLVPGKLYSAEAITADYEDITHGVSHSYAHGFALSIEGAKTTAEGAYHNVPVSSPWSHEQLPFKDGPAFFNHHRILFRATSDTAKLILGDGAPESLTPEQVGRQLMVNYIQVGPYFEGERP